MKINSIQSDNIYPQFKQRKIEHVSKISHRINSGTKKIQTPKLVLALLGLLTTIGIVIGSGLVARQKFNDKIEKEKAEFLQNAEAFNMSYEFGKKKILDALNSDNPYEHLIAINNLTNEIVADTTESDAFGVSANIFLEKENLQKGLTLLHGHPNDGEYTSPVGFGDFKTLVDNYFITSVTAFNKDGQVSMLSKTPDFKMLDKQVLENIKKDIGVNLAHEAFRVNEPELYEELKNILLTSTDNIKRKNAEEAIKQHLADQDTTRYFFNGIHKYWEKNAEKLGLKYYTNFNR